MRTLLISLILVGVTTSLCSQTIQVKVGKQQIIGKPIFWDDYEVAVIERDSKVSSFAASQAKDYKVLAKSFRFYSQAEQRALLQKEFGRGFEVSGTGQYLVVHPAGQRDLWADRFEELYRSMVNYYSIRGINVKPQSFPFIAVVFPSRSMYLNYTRKVNGSDVSRALGHYSPRTNRVYLFDITHGMEDKSAWYINAETIIHEAAHQTAFNIGVHRRFGAAPAWAIEGIGTMFEARGVWNASQFPGIKERINKQQLSVFQQQITRANAYDHVKNIIASDKLFDRSTSKAYALAWAMTFYANESQPRQYGDLINRMHQRKSFNPYSATRRLNDFRTSFGDIERFAINMMNYYETELE